MLYRAGTADVIKFLKAFNETVTPEVDIFSSKNNVHLSPYPDSRFVYITKRDGALDDGGLHTALGFYGKTKATHSLISPIPARSFDEYVDFPDLDGDHLVVLTADLKMLGFKRVLQANEDYPFQRKFQSPGLASARLLVQDSDFKPYAEGIRFLVEFDTPEDSISSKYRIVLNTPIRDYKLILDKDVFYNQRRITKFPFDLVESLGIQTFGDLEKVTKFEFQRNFLKTPGLSRAWFQRLEIIMAAVGVKFKPE